MQNFLEKPFSIIRYESITDLCLVWRGSLKSSVMWQVEVFMLSCAAQHTTVYLCLPNGKPKMRSHISKTTTIVENHCSNTEILLQLNLLLGY